jgi:hypothetical protein
VWEVPGFSRRGIDGDLLPTTKEFPEQTTTHQTMHINLPMCFRKNVLKTLFPETYGFAQIALRKTLKCSREALLSEL